jgi:hypothetical protein
MHMRAAKHWIPVGLLAALLLAVLPDAASAGGRHGGGHSGGHGGHGGGHGHGHSGRFFVGFGLPYFWAPPIYVGPRYYAPYAYPYPAYAPYPGYAPRVVVQEPPVYIERGSAGSWYYCESAGAYYPDVETCAEPWVRVPAQD